MAFCSIVGHASIQTARGIGPSTIERSKDFTETVHSMEVEHQKVEKAGAGDEIAIKVVDRARQHDQVFKVV